MKRVFYLTFHKLNTKKVFNLYLTSLHVNSFTYIIHSNLEIFYDIQGKRFFILRFRVFILINIHTESEKTTMYY